MSIDAPVLSVFEEAVLADIKGHPSEVQSVLLKENLQQWIDSLIGWLRDVDIQFSARKAQTAAVRADTYGDTDEAAWLEHQVTDKEWRLKTNRFRASIEARLRYAKSLRVIN